MDRNSTFAFLLIGVILVVWLYWNSPTPEPQKPKTTTTLQQKDTAKAVVPVVAEEKKQEDVSPFGPSNQAEKVVTIETELSRFELTNKGGRIKRVFLKKYNTWYFNNTKDTTFYKKFVQLVNTAKSGGDFNLIFVTKDGKLVNTSSLDFNADKNNSYYKLSGKDSLSIEYAFAGDNGKVIKKSFMFFGDKYDSKVDIVLENMQDMISSFRYDVVWQNGLNFVEENSVDEANYSHANVYTGEENVTVDASTIGEKVTKDVNGKVDWVGVRNKYFAAFISPKNPSSEGGAYVEGNHYNNKY
ncbi:MAG: membrane protein insertase YidC, partial [Ignavibacteria bacterium]|nr:membrane protein insertase YidC [Ignavibacteria bacterium]